MKLNGTLIVGLIVVAVLLLGAGYALANVRGAAEPVGIETVSYTHLTLPTKRIV